MTAMHVYGLGADGQWSPMLNTGLGSAAGGGSAASASNTVPWVYAAASGGITDTADVTLAAAAGVGKSNFITAIQVCNKSATQTEVVVKDGATIIWRQVFGASMISPVDIKLSLNSSENTALKAACITNATATYICAQGYVDYSPAERLAAVQNYDELFDDNGAQIYDNSSNNALIYVQ